MKRDKTIGWMHPSWRDLVIERLSVDAEARKHFLSRCGIHGFLLAISSAGGTRGQRNAPLLVTPADWESLRETAVRLIKSSDTYKTWLVLTALHEAILNHVTTHKIRVVAGDSCMGVLARYCLHACAEKWATDDPDQQSRTVDRFFTISVLIDPLPPSPNLGAIWECHVDAARTAVDNFDSDDTDLSCDALVDWLDLAAIVLANEPRLLRQVDFPHRYIDVPKMVLPRFNRRARLDVDPSDPDDCDAEERRLTDMREMVESIEELFPALSEDCSRTLQIIDEGLRQCQREREKLEERNYAEQESEDEDGRVQISRRRPQIALSIDGLRMTERLSNLPVDVSRLFQDL